ncbi:MAG TPA: hypothetical protein VJV78_35915 [Polyangiales bacterium]|nr:hypothetical protein [Polyangiales bacterium]
MPPRPRIADPLSPALLDALRAQLAEGERIAWAASSEPAAFLSEKRGIGKWETVAILGGGYALLGAGIQAFRTGQWLWMCVPLAFLVFGIASYLVSSRIKARARKTREGTVYGITTRRALIVRTYPAVSVQALPLGAITDVTVRDERGDFADLCVHTAETPAAFVFPALTEAERARTQIMKVVRDPKGTDEQIAAAESYALMMRQMMRPASR